MVGMLSAWFTFVSSNSSRFPNTAGDGLDWEIHCHEHYNDLFLEFAEHKDKDADVELVNVQLYPDTDMCISHKVGSGFRGEFSEYHQHIEDGVAFTPMFCVWCVHNNQLSMVERITQ